MALLNFVDRSKLGNEPLRFTFDHDWSGIPFVSKDVEVHDACALDEPPRLDREGFTKAKVDCADLSALAPEEREAAWAPAVCRAIKQLTGADEVVSWGFSARYSERKADAPRNEVSNPARRVHGDFSPTAFGEEIDHAPAETALAPVLRGRRPKRWIGFNAWQPFSRPPYDTPLAVCDTRSLDPGDVVIGTGSAKSMPDLVLDLPLFAHGPGQRWYYFSDLAQDEALLFVGIDSAGPARLGANRWSLVPHAAFDNAHCPPDAAPRCSVELRAMAMFFENEGCHE